MKTNKLVNTYRVLFISFMNWDSLMEMPALLEKGGATVDLFCTPDSWVLKNKSYDRAIIADDNADTFVTRLLEYIGQHFFEYEWIIPGDDGIIRLLNERIKSDEWFQKIMPITKIENRSLLGSKAGFSDLCTKYNIRTPRYMVYRDGVMLSHVVETVGFPMMIKADKSEGGVGVYLCNNKAELAYNMSLIKDKRDLVFQQYIVGHEVNTEVLAKDGKLVVYNYSRRLKTIGTFGVSTQRMYTVTNALEIELKHICNSIGLDGFGNVVFMYNELDKNHYLIEVDARPNSWMFYGKFTGNDFSEGIRRIIAGNTEFIAPKGKAGKDTFVALYKKDVYRAIIEKDFKELLKWALNWNSRWKYVPVYDFRILKSINTFLYATFQRLFVQKLKRDYRLDLHFHSFHLPKVFTLARYTL